MCDNLYIVRRCYRFHEGRGEWGARLDSIVLCSVAEAAGVTCQPPLGSIHRYQEDLMEQDCAECKGETPPVTPV